MGVKAACIVAASVAFGDVVEAQSTEYRVDAQPLETALLEFAREARLSISFSGINLAGIMSPGVQNSRSKRAALQKLLNRTGFGFRFIDRNTVQIYRLTVSDPNTSSDASGPYEPGTDFIEDVVVTATKRPSANFELPVSVSGISSLVLEDLGSYDLQSLAGHITGVSTTNLGPGRNKIFIRGLSDGPFADRTQTIVGVYIDETPINFSDTNPDVRLFDAERVEIVRGPQGTLYGAGSLGGLYRVITSKPDLSETGGRTRLSISATNEGGTNGLLDFVFNTPIVSDKLAFRITGYADIQDGYIDDIAQDIENTNDLQIYGVRPSLRWKINNRWMVDSAFNIQSIRYEDSQYFTEDLGQNTRANVIPEPYDDDFIQANITLKGDLGSVQLTSASAYVHREITETADASRSEILLDDLTGIPAESFLRASLLDFADTEEFLALPSSDAIAYFTRSEIETFSHETRLQSNGNGRFHWLLGGFYLGRRQVINNLLALAPDDLGARVALVEDRREEVDDLAVFGEVTYHLSDKLSLTGGLRFSHNVFNLRFDAQSVFAGEEQPIDREEVTDRFIPKFALRYEWSEDVQTYAQVSVGYRAGGININTPLEAFLAAIEDAEEFAPALATDFQSDTLINYELGLKSYWFDRRLSLNLTAFYVDWSNIQSDQLDSIGFPFTTNVGSAHNLGVEAEFSARLFSGFELRGSFFWNDSELQNDNSFLGAQEGDRLPNIPKVTTSLAGLYQFDLNNEWTATISADLAYRGSSSLTFDETNSPTIDDYGILNARLQVAKGNWKLGIFGQNLTNTHANTFAFGNSFTRSGPRQVTPPRPFTLGLFVEREF